MHVTICTNHASSSSGGGGMFAAPRQATTSNTIHYNPTADMMSEMMTMMAIINTPPATKRTAGVRES